jgi:hypothetical protein
MINRHVKRLLISACVSVIVVSVMAKTFRIISSPEDLSIFDQIIITLYAPAVAIVDLLIGEGKSLDRIWAYWGVSLVFYALSAWIILSLWGRLRLRGRSGDAESRIS